MNVFFVCSTGTGCSKWRSEIPAKYLRRRGHTATFYANRKGAQAPDVMVFSRVYQHDLFKLFNWAKDRKIRVVYDTDDALALVDPSNPGYKFALEHQKESEQMAAHADVVTTTTPELAAHLRTLNPNVVVVPNSVDPEDWTVEPRKPGGPVRVGWLGGSTHFYDLAIVTEAVADLVRKLKFEFVIYGITSLPSVQNFYRNHLKTKGDVFRDSHMGRAIKTFLRRTERLPYTFVPFVPPIEYAETLCDLRLDIGIAPLEDTPFNRHKSAIKYYEYGMSGAVTLASNVLPYSTEVPHLADNTRDSWKARLTELLEADRAALLKDQRAWILEHRNIERNVAMWERVLQG